MGVSNLPENGPGDRFDCERAEPNSLSDRPQGDRTVTLTGHILVPPDRLDAVRAGLPEHIRLSRAEPGCLNFDVTERADIPGRFDVSESFTDAQAFDAHQTRTRASDWARITDGIARDYQVTGLDDG